MYWFKILLDSGFHGYALWILIQELQLGIENNISVLKWKLNEN